MEETQDTNREKAPSVPAFIGSMQSEDLVRLAEELRELQQHPGWKAFTDVLEVHHRDIVSRATRRGLPTETGLPRSIDDMVQAGMIDAFAGGRAQAIRDVQQILDRIESTTERVTEIIAGADEGEGR